MDRNYYNFLQQEQQIRSIVKEVSANHGKNATQTSLYTKSHKTQHNIFYSAFG